MPDPDTLPELAVPLPGGGRPSGLILRPWRQADAGDVADLCQDPDIQRWTSVPSPYSLDDAVRFIDHSAAAWIAGGAASFAVCDAASDAILASVTLRCRLDEPRHAEVGYWCGADARGRGVMTTATRAICTWGFEELSLARISWYADRGNEASWRVALQVGFRFEGAVRAVLPDGHGSFVDAWSGGLLPGEVATGRVPLPFGADPVLRDGPVTVRRWREEDVDAYVALRADDSVREWEGDFGSNAPTRSSAYERLCVADVEGWLMGTRAAFAIDVEGTPAGHVGVQRVHPRLAEIGWWLGSAHRGRGVAGRALGRVVHWAESVGLERLEARVHADNGPSQALAERAGFRREGRLSAEAPHHGRWEDAYLYGLLTADRP
jgi:RimJ/RimL family protein N-acetyltransferase